MLEIRLLGRFEIKQNGQAVEIRSRPAQSLLAYLLLQPGPHRREQLAGLFWPTTTDASARRSLRQALWQIRRAIETDDRHCLLIDNLTIAFNSQAECWLDIAILDPNLKTAAATDDLQQAVEAYQGELLPGFYDEWLLPERERLRVVFDRRMTAWLDRLVSAGRWSEVEEWGERWIALGSAPEPAYRALMMAWAGQGDLSHVAAIYQRCAEALGRELGVEPAEQTTALYRNIQSGFWKSPSHGPSQPRHNLPEQLASFIGRETAIADVQHLMSAHRLITLVGPGGMGKTRLALQVAAGIFERYPDGVWFTTFASLANSELVPQTVAAALGIRDESPRPILDRLNDALRPKKILLILDNCEHLIEACAQLAASILANCPNLRILATSREVMNIAGEALYWIPSLSLPDLETALSIESLGQSEAVRLFVKRANSILPGFELTDDNAPAVGKICSRLDGIPLAIELAAARVTVLGVEQIAARLDDRFRLLTGGSRLALPRYQTMQASIDWSYDLLPAAEQRLFRELSVFAGGWSLEAAEALSHETPPDLLDLLTGLVSKSLVVVAGEQTPRYHLLETIREYARQKLTEIGDMGKFRERHLDYFVTLAEEAKADIRGPNEALWLARLETEIDNIRAALAWSLDKNVEAGLELAGALWYFWDAHGYTKEGAVWLTRLLARSAAQPPTLAQAGALLALSDLHINQNSLAQAQGLAEEALKLYQHHEEEYGIALGSAVLGRTLVLQHGPSSAQGRKLLEESLALFKEIDSKPDIGWVLAMLGGTASQDYQQGRKQLEESLALFRSLGCMADVGAVLTTLAANATHHGEFDQARVWLEESLPITRQLSRSGLGFTLFHLGNLALRQADYEQARQYYEECLHLTREAGDNMNGWWTLSNLGYLALRQGDTARARMVFEESLGLFQGAGIKIGVVYVLEGFASLLTQGWPSRAAQLYAWADVMRVAAGDPRPITEQVDVDKDLDSIRIRLDAGLLETAVAQGRALTMEQAIAKAMEKPDA